MSLDIILIINSLDASNKSTRDERWSTLVSTVDTKLNSNQIFLFLQFVFLWFSCLYITSIEFLYMAITDKPVNLFSTIIEQ